MEYEITFNKLDEDFEFTMNGDLDRNVLFEKCINKILEENPSSLDWQIYYADDRADNLQLVKCYYPEIITYHCKNMYELYLFKFIICDTFS